MRPNVLIATLIASSALAASTVAEVLALFADERDAPCRFLLRGRHLLPVRQSQQNIAVAGLRGAPAREIAAAQLVDVVDERPAVRTTSVSFSRSLKANFDLGRATAYLYMQWTREHDELSGGAGQLRYTSMREMSGAPAC